MRHLQPAYLLGPVTQSGPSGVYAVPAAGPGASAWNSVLAAEPRALALAVARDVAVRCADGALLEEAIRVSPSQSRFPQVVRWDPYGIAEGDAGMALAFGYLDACFPGEDWDRVAHKHLTRAAGAVQRAGIPALGLFSGLAGLVFAASQLSRGGQRYRRLLESLDAALVAHATRFAADLARSRDGVAVSEFDAITGLSGVAAVLLARGRERPDVRAATEAVLAALVAMVESDADPPRWHTPAHLMGDAWLAREFPMGSLNCGLAHGIPGPAAVMALALRDGVEVRGQVAVLRRICEWLLLHRVDDTSGINWPTAVPARAMAEPPPSSQQPSRAAWCYGSPGVARSLWLAGDALGDEELRRYAVEAMLAVYRRSLNERNIDSPTICHGVAGLLQITLRFAHDTGLTAFADAATALAAQLLSARRPDRLLGYCSLEPGGTEVDRPGVLDGAPGVAVVLLAAATDAEPTWDRLFLLA